MTFPTHPRSIEEKIAEWKRLASHGKLDSSGDDERYWRTTLQETHSQAVFDTIQRVLDVVEELRDKEGCQNALCTQRAYCSHQVGRRQNMNAISSKIQSLLPKQQN